LNRRAALVGAAAAIAAALGIRAQLGRQRGEPDDEAEAAAIDLWSLSFPSLEGAPVAMAGWRGKPLLLNFWATWCAPCVVEMPLLDRFARERSAERWQVLALAVDQPDPVRRFVAERNLRVPVALAGGAGLDLSRQLGNQKGGLPFTAAFDSTGTKVHHHLGAVDAELLAEWVRSTR
jgi:thiol-disulfide isomerase/thioredoxin